MINVDCCCVYTHILYLQYSTHMHAHTYTKNTLPDTKTCAHHTNTCTHIHTQSHTLNTHMHVHTHKTHAHTHIHTHTQRLTWHNAHKGTSCYEVFKPYLSFISMCVYLRVHESYWYRQIHTRHTHIHTHIHTYTHRQLYIKRFSKQIYTTHPVE